MTLRKASLLLIVVCLFAVGDNLLDIMSSELARSVEGLSTASESPMYFLAYGITDYHRINISYNLGALLNEADYRERILDIDLRVGDYHRDNTHEVRDRYGGQSYDRGIGRVDIPINNDETAIRDAIWIATDEAYKDAIEKYQRVMRNLQVRVETGDTSSDFSAVEPSVYIGETVSISVDEELWHSRLKKLSGRMKQNPAVHGGSAGLRSTAVNSFFVNSEGTKIRQGKEYFTLSLYVSTVADDGMELYRLENYSSDGVEDFPDEDELIAMVDSMVADLVALRESEEVEPYIGPAILMNRASGVFFHEIFGHRIEGHRQKSITDGQTFSDKVGEEILPSFISVYDDPTVERFGDVALRGYYLYDCEGTPARRVDVVKDGVLNEFLMSRSPIENFPKSTGHGRRQPGNRAVSRQGNLFIKSSNELSYQELREALVEEIIRQGKPFGLLFADISGGFTMTRRWMPQSFKVQPLLVYKVFADGREDELVHGVDIVGTPLTSFSTIIATADDYAVFNGSCGAESGMISVSAISPSILVSQIEVEKQMKGQDRPPILPPPAHGGKE